MIRIVLNNGFNYKGEILEEDSEFLVLKDVKSKEVHIKKTAIVVREVLDDTY